MIGSSFLHTLRSAADDAAGGVFGGVNPSTLWNYSRGALSGDPGRVLGPLAGMSKTDIVKRASGFDGMPSGFKGWGGRALGVGGLATGLGMDAYTIANPHASTLDKVHAGLNAGLTGALSARFGPGAGTLLANVGDMAATGVGDGLGWLATHNDPEPAHWDGKVSGGTAAPSTDMYGKAMPTDKSRAKPQTLESFLAAMGATGKPAGLSTLSHLQDQINARYDALKADLNGRYSNRDNPTAQEKRLRDFNLADMESERRAALGAINNAFDIGRHNNYVTTQDTRGDAKAAGRQTARAYNDTADQIVADAKAFGAGMQGGAKVSGAAGDAARVARQSATSHAALERDLGNITADQLATLGAGMETQRQAQSGDTGRAAMAERAGFTNQWSQQVAAREAADQAAYNDAMTQAANDQISQLGQIGMQTADYQNSAQQSMLGDLRQMVMDNGGDTLANVISRQASHATGGGNLQLNGTPMGQALAGPMTTAMDMNGVPHYSDKLTIDAARVRNPITVALKTAPADRASFNAYWAGKMNELMGADLQAYYALEHAGYTDPNTAWTALHGGN